MGLEHQFARRCTERGWDVFVVPHIYHLPADSAVWDEIAALTGPVGIASWLHPRPAEWLLREHGIEPAIACDLAACGGADDALSILAEALGEADGTGEVRELAEPIAERWYPVLDRSRCLDCRHCLQFCIFGVYEIDGAGRVVAVKPDNCKPGCPACSRICPEGAIIFPTCDEPAIAGAPGTLMAPDAVARRMFYVRTKRTCPACGGIAEAGERALALAGTESCAECGRPLEAAEPAQREPSVVHDEIDALIDALDDLAGEGGR